MGGGLRRPLAKQFAVVLGELAQVAETPGVGRCSDATRLAAQLTADARVGCNDAGRNCISNVRPEGLPYAQAAWKLAYLINGARRLGCTGVRLKDDSDTPAALASP